MTCLRGKCIQHTTCQNFKTRFRPRCSSNSILSSPVQIGTKETVCVTMFFSRKNSGAILVMGCVNTKPANLSVMLKYSGYRIVSSATLCASWFSPHVSCLMSRARTIAISINTDYGYGRSLMGPPRNKSTYLPTWCYLPDLANLLTISTPISFIGFWRRSKYMEGANQIDRW